MKTDLKHLFRWLQSTPWTETPLYPGRAQKPEDQAKYDAAMATKKGISKTIYALLDCFAGPLTLAPINLAAPIASPWTRWQFRPTSRP